MSEFDPFELLRQDLDAEAEQLRDPPSPDRLIAELLTGTSSVGKPRRIRRGVIAAGVITVVAVGGAAAALWPRAAPPKPQAGVGCRAAAELDASMVVLPPGPDPVGRCAVLWTSGRLPDVDRPGRPTESAPGLFACIGVGGGLEVFPADDDVTTCASLGLVDAVLDDSQPGVLEQLRDLLGERINRECVAVDEAERRASETLAELELTEWVVRRQAGDGPCSRASVDAELDSVFLIPAQSS